MSGFNALVTGLAPMPIAELPQAFIACREQRALLRKPRRALHFELKESPKLKSLLHRHFQVPYCRRFERQLAGSLASVALLLTISHGTTSASTITVTTNVAAVASDGRCSLAEAIINANNDGATHTDCVSGSGADVIVLPSSTKISLAGSLDNTYGSSALPAITSSITIEGNGSKIMRKKAKLVARIFAVTPSGDLTLKNVTISGGLEENGGAVFNAGTLKIFSSTISGNKAIYGGAVFNTSTGELSVEDSAVANNVAAFAGGGIYVHGGAVGIWATAITGNKSDAGGGVFIHAGSVSFDDIVISRNTATSHGSGMWVEGGTVSIANGTIANNKARYSAGGLLNQGGILTVQNSTISRNKAGFSGGGVELTAGKAVFYNSTISGNSAKYGAGVLNQFDNTFISTTITANAGKTGGGVFNSAGRVTLNHSLISGNRAKAGREFYADSSNGALVSANDFNLFGFAGDAGIIGFTLGPTDIVPASNVKIGLILAPLADNGGPTLTHALVQDSVAIDAVPGAHPDCSGTDQRGVDRPQGFGCDIGAFEK